MIPTIQGYLKIPPQTFFDTTIKQLPDRIGFRYGEQLKNYHFIMNREDKSETEQVLLNWNGENWTIREF